MNFFLKITLGFISSLGRSKINKNVSNSSLLLLTPEQQSIVVLSYQTTPKCRCNFLLFVNDT